MSKQLRELQARKSTLVKDARDRFSVARRELVRKLSNEVKQSLEHQKVALIGVSAHSLYKWVSAVKPDKTDQQASELLAAKSEILRLRAQLHRTEEERDILKKAARYFAKELE
jgi:transposase-like protein